MVKMLPMPASMLPFHPLPYRRKQRKMPLIRPKPFSKKKQKKRPSKLRQKNRKRQLRLSLNMQKQKANRSRYRKVMEELDKRERRRAGRE